VYFLFSCCTNFYTNFIAGRELSFLLLMNLKIACAVFVNDEGKDRVCD